MSSSISRVQKNWITLVIFSLFCTLIYKTYDFEIYTYLCEEEGNGPACYILSNKYEQSTHHSKSERYLFLSCEQKYERACLKLKGQSKDD